jgi:hypothetical protein
MPDAVNDAPIPRPEKPPVDDDPASQKMSRIRSEQITEIRKRCIGHRDLPFNSKLTLRKGKFPPLICDCLNSVNGQIAFAFFASNFNFIRNFACLGAEINSFYSVQHLLSEIGGCPATGLPIDFITILEQFLLRRIFYMNPSCDQLSDPDTTDSLFDRDLYDGTNYYNNEDYVIFGLRPDDKHGISRLVESFQYVPNIKELILRIKTQADLAWVNKYINTVGVMEFELDWAMFTVGVLNTSVQLKGAISMYLLMRFDQRTYCVVRDGIWQSVRTLNDLKKRGPEFMREMGSNRSDISDYLYFACYKRVWRPIR